jgi:outer membrane protein assembly factor BamB
MNPERIRPVVLVALLALPLGPASAQTDNWPEFRGLQGKGLAEGRGIPDTWSATENVLWKTDVPGVGWSSPIVWGDRVFVTAAVGDRRNPKMGRYAPGDIIKPSTSQLQFTLFCIDFRSGKVLWQRVAYEGPPPQPIHVKASHASETPATDGNRVVACFGGVGVFCYDLDGHPLWHYKLKPHRTEGNWGTGASPRIHQDRVYLQVDNQEESFLTALDLQTGNEIWRVDRKEYTSWATPLVWHNKVRTEIVAAGPKMMRGYGLDGKQLWELAAPWKLPIGSPVGDSELVYVGTGYYAGGPLYAVKAGAAGDISLAAKQTSNEGVAWNIAKGAAYHTTPLLIGGRVYVLFDQGSLSCYDAASGKVIYDRQPLAGVGQFTASPVVCGGRIYCLSENGTTCVIEEGPQFKLLTKNSLDESCLATPAIARGSILIRTLVKIYRVGREQFVHPER